jgi:hypothetical protein
MGVLGTAWMAAKSALLYTNPGMFLFAGIIMSWVGLIGTQYTKPTYRTDQWPQYL